MPITRWRPFGKIEQWEPFGDVDALRREMNNLLEQFTSNLPAGGGSLGNFAFMPSAEINETEDEIHLKLEVPGMKADDLDIEVMDDAVSIKGERKAESKTEENGNFRSEFHYGKFERLIPMPTHVEKENVVAEYKDGVLRLNIPKSTHKAKETVKVKLPTA
ncbi:MAG: Hsp20/alpha crystallin family protein [Phormidesmis sp. RL_2_1]|nr:Hsp20/alpha crystallin family protein [Phormidesmis sp. RL_2_1]